MSEYPALADIVDQEDAIKMMERWSGTVLRIPIPENLPKHDLRKVLGAARARQLAAEYGGQRVYIPKMESATRRERDNLIRSKRAEGASIQALATEFGLSSRMVHYLCEGTKVDA